MVGHKCPKCGKVMDTVVCPCEPGRVVLAEDGFLGKKGDVLVVTDVEPIVRHPRKKPNDPIQHDVDMVAYDAEMEAAGFEFVDDLHEYETKVTFLAEPEASVLEVAVTSYYGGERLLGSYVFDGGVLRWKGKRREDGRVYPEPFDGGPVRASDRIEDGWFKQADDPERWLRAVPGYLAMRGHLGAKIVTDRKPKERSHA